MKLCVIGTGYVGLVAGTCLAEMGNEVICIDNDLEKINKLKQGIIPIYEPGLEELLSSNVSEKRLSFSTNLEEAVQKSEVCFIAVGTPQSNDGAADLTYVFDVAKSIAKSMKSYKVIVNKSTSPVGTADKIRETIAQNTNCEFDVVSNPEFLKQGAAVEDFLKPDRVIIGSSSKKATELMQEIYSPFMRTGNRVIIMDIKSAEMTKYASNSFLAMKISFANEIANICEKLGADSELVRVGMSTDKRIGSQFLFAGLGYGGSCFPKDVKALIKIAEENDCPHDLLKATDTINKNQRLLFVNKITKRFGDNLKGKTFAVWGLAFKPKTNDMREAPAITIINKLLEKGAKIQAYDPKATESAKEIFKDKIIYKTNAYDVLNGADALLLLTEWNEFRRPNFETIRENLTNPIIFDGRNQYDKARLLEYGFEYYCIGKSSSQTK